MGYYLALNACFVERKVRVKYDTLLFQHHWTNCKVQHCEGTALNVWRSHKESWSNYNHLCSRRVHEGTYPRMEWCRMLEDPHNPPRYIPHHIEFSEYDKSQNVWVWIHWDTVGISPCHLRLPAWCLHWQGLCYSHVLSDSFIYIQYGNAIIHMIKEPSTNLWSHMSQAFRHERCHFCSWLIPSLLNQSTRKALSWCQWKIEYLMHKYSTEWWEWWEQSPTVWYAVKGLGSGEDLKDIRWLLW